MEFRNFLVVFILLCVCRVAAKSPNILFIVVDDLRPSLGAYGDPDAITPYIDELAREGIIFHNAFAQQALCAPSRNSFLTSRRPDTLHLYDFYSYWRTFAGNFTTLPQYFKENNYHTKSIGKVFHPGISSNYDDDFPFSWSEKPWHPPTEIFKDSPVCQTPKGWFSNLICPVKVREQPRGTLPDIEIVEEAIKFLKRRKSEEKPFFLAVGFHKPHIPLKFPKKYLELYPLKNITLPGLRSFPPGLPTVAWNPWTDIRSRDDIAGLNVTFPYASLSDDWVLKIRQAYFASVSYIDDLVKELLVGLKATNLHKNTIVVLLGDHGWSLGEHGEWSKYSNFDVAVRVPLIMRIPKLTYPIDSLGKRGKQVSELVELVDLFPTLVDLAGLKPIPKCPKDSSDVMLCTQGDSMVPLIIEKDTQTHKTHGDTAWKNYSLSQYPRPGVKATESPNSDKPKLNQIKIMGYSIRTHRHRYTQWIPWNSETLSGDWSRVIENEFYDHHIDPEENLNLAGRPGLQDIEEQLISLLRQGFGVC